VREAKTALVLSETKRSLAMLDAFMQRTMHILRTPVAVALNYIEELRLNLLTSTTKVEEEDEEEESPLALVANSKRMLEVVWNITTDVADIATMERGVNPAMHFEVRSAAHA
jgi:signal transduction histidine kinase